jgi:hypothetical protein
MKIQKPNSGLHPQQSQRSEGFQRGFALVVTLSLMVLLTVISVGLLTLSSISLRSTNQGEDRAIARANARMALMLALGELQKSAGPDMSITATSSMIAEAPLKPNLTGVWASKSINPNSPPSDYASEKSAAFKRWLVSGVKPTDHESQDYVTTPQSGETLELVGKNSLGPAATDSDKVIAGVVPVSRDGRRYGSYAWHVADEGVKATYNTYRDPSRNTTLAHKRSLIAGHRADVSQMEEGGMSLDFLPKDETSSNYEEAMKHSGKLITLNQADLFKAGSSIKSFRNDITPYSRGLLVDVRDGGLKQDLTSMFEYGSAMPPPYDQGSDVRLYASTHKITGVSDPNWSTLGGYYRMYGDLVDKDTKPTIKSIPQESVSLTALAPPQNYFPAPVIAKIEMIFSFVVHDPTGNWLGTITKGDSTRKYMGYLISTPVITLHNPYNVNLRFDRLKVSMKNVPAGFIFTVNNVARNKKLTPINEMTNLSANRGDKIFIIEIANWANTTQNEPTGGPITMNPGQTLVCGTYVNPTDGLVSTFDWANNMTGFDKKTGITKPVKAKPGFLASAAGFTYDWLTPHNSTDYVDPTTLIVSKQGMLALRATDQISIESGLALPSVGVKDRFEVVAEITAGKTTTPCGGLSFIYNDESTLTGLLPTPKYRFPRTGSLKAGDLYYSNTEPLINQSNAKAFAIFSAYARTTNGGVYESGKRQPQANAANELRDGRLAGKAFLFHNPARPVIRLNLATEKPGNQSHEINYQPLPGNTDDMIDIDSLNRTPALMSNRLIGDKSIKSGSYLEIPSGPMQTIADFRRSNALTSSYLPSFVQPVGNSYVSPMMSTGKVSEAGPAGYDLLDHSYLANHALYDKFYFSTFAPVDSKDASQLFSKFMGHEERLISQRFEPNLPSGKTVATAQKELFSSANPTPDAYRLAAQYQTVRGAFNVNSTNVQAWIAMLSSLNKSELAVLWGKSGTLESIKSDQIPIPSMSLQNSGSATSQKANDTSLASNRWNGFRELSRKDVERLAYEIVNKVRERGPFLSMSEFVNRRLGPESELTRAGALQQAIDLSKINDETFADQIVEVNAADLTDPKLYNYKTPKVMEGNPAAGAPGWISQGDLLRILEPAATVRSDTFVIRAAGEAQDKTGKVTARAYAEAVVQRTVDYVNPVDAPTVNAEKDSMANPVNKVFGRKFELVSFRWLSSHEI